MSERLYKGAVVGLMLTLMGVVMGIASPGLSDTDLGIVDTQIHLPVVLTTAALYLIILSRIFTHPARVMNALSSMKLLLPVAFFSIASAAWSTDPGTTLRRACFFLLSTLVGIILGSEFDIPQLGRLFAVASFLHIACCAVLFFVARHLLYSPSDPLSLKGLTTHKNIFGMEMGLALLMFLLIPLGKVGQLRWLLVLIAGTLLFLSHSSGSLVATICALAFLPLLLIAHFPKSQRVPLTLLSLILLAGAGILLVENAALLPAVFSKDVTLSGRTELWSLILIAIRQHPLLGYGYDSFWRGLQGESLTIIRGVGWLVPTAHNGYLDLLLGIGGIGAFLFLIPFMQTVVRSFRYLGIEHSTARYLPIPFLVFWLVHNLNESALLTRSGITYFLFTAFSTRLALQFAGSRATSHVNQAAYGSPPLIPELPPY